MGDVFILVCNFHVPLALKVGSDIVLVSIFLCVGLMSICCGVTSYSGFLPIGVHFVFSCTWCGVARLLVEFLRLPCCFATISTWRC
jgi:hypothetical protein